LVDPIRLEVPDAVEQCRRAGVDVLMVTGDHPETARAVASELKLIEPNEKIMTGVDLKQVSGDPADRRREIAKTKVFARIEPTQKTDIVSILQDQGHFVAVTGDGVNDAPALRAAHVGVAMGRNGTDVARQAADLIITDDNFASIVGGVEEGRIAYENVRKVTWLLISTGVAEITLFALAFIFNTPLPLSAVQLLWLNLVTQGIQDVALAFERGEPGVLEKPPRPPDEPIFNRQMIERALLSDMIMGCIAFGVFYYLHNVAEWSEFDARNGLLLLMVLFENVHVFNCRSETRSVFRIPLSANPFLIATVIAAQGLHLVAMYTPGLRDILDVQPVTLTTWSAMATCALSVIVTMELYKWYRRRVPIERSGMQSDRKIR
jgi:magnesium-transporting ATPase (P-type)